MLPGPMGRNRGRELSIQRAYAKVNAGAQGREYDDIADRVARETRGAVLDWGSGLGQVTARLVARGVPVSAYDYRPDEPPGTARFEYFPGLHYRHSPEPVRLPYSDGAFSAVLSLGVLEHVADPAGSLREIHRVLTPRGRFYVYKLPNQFSYLEWIARHVGMDYHGIRPDDRLYTLESARTLLTKHGFEVREASLANLLPLTISGTRPRLVDLLWTLNGLLGRAPALRRAATNVQLIADKQ
jgi:SAM-dependent methyltransferase